MMAKVMAETAQPRRRGWQVAIGGAASLFLWAPGGAAQEEVTELDPIVVEARRANGTTPVEGYVAEQTRSGSKVDVPLRELPRSVEVIGREELEDRGAATMIEALRYSAGVATGFSGFDPRFDQVRLRGFAATTSADYRDGLRQVPGTYATFRSELWGIDRIDVVKGPASALYGQSSPGGLVDRISKLAEARRIREAMLRTTSHGAIETGIDWGDALTEDGSLSWRFVGLLRRGDTDFDIADDRLMLAPSLTWEGADDKLTLFALFQRDETDSNISALNRNGEAYEIRASDPDYDYQKQTQAQLGYMYEHRFAPNISFRQKLRYGYADLDARYLTGGVTGGGWTTDASGTAYYARGRYAIGEKLNTLQNDNQLHATFDTGPLRHEAVAGIDYQWLYSLYRTGSAAASAEYALYPNDPDYGRSGATPDYTTGRITRMGQLGIYANDVISFGNWRAHLGVRHDTVERVQKNNLTGANTADQDDSATTVSMGLLYAFENGVSAYASYGTSFQPNTYVDATGNALSPSKGEQVEIGLKYATPDGRSLFTIAAYHLREKEAAKYAGYNSTVGSYYEAIGEVTSDGIELQARTKIGEGLSLLASWAWNDAEITDDVTASYIGNVPLMTPEHMGSLWAEYELQRGALAGLSLGAGARYTGKTWTSSANTQSNDAFTQFDAGLSYDFGNLDRRWQGLKGALNVTNIEGRREPVCNSGYCYLGEGRTVSARINYTF